MSPNKRTKAMSENAIGNKSKEFICKNIGIGRRGLAVQTREGGVDNPRQGQGLRLQRR